MTDFFNTTVGMSYNWAWFTATIVGILVIALPLMLAVAMMASTRMISSKVKPRSRPGINRLALHATIGLQPDVGVIFFAAAHAVGSVGY